MTHNNDPNFVLPNNFLMLASRYSCLNVSIWDFATISFGFISAIVIFDLLRMFDLSNKSICLYADAIFHFLMTSNFTKSYKKQHISQQIKGSIGQLVWYFVSNGLKMLPAKLLNWNLTTENWPLTACWAFKKLFKGRLLTFR